ncbi:MAG: hypothetical protein ACXWPM_06050 [Bdellovibrionota bacterium]
MLAGLLLASCLLGVLHWSNASLQKGQVIKQFFSYSISESLAHGNLNPLSTEISCEHGTQKRAWAEEPPVFHYFAAPWVWVFPNVPFLAPFLSYLLLLMSIYRILRHCPFVAEEKKFLVLALAACAPAFLRYSIQFLPDLFAIGLLGLGVSYQLERRTKAALFLFCVAITTKALNVVPVAFILGADLWWESSKRPALWNWVGLVLRVAAVSLPVLLWIALLFLRHVPNPLFHHWQVEFQSRDSLRLLFSAHYWTRFMAWVAAKGAGIVLFCFAVAGIARTVRTQAQERSAVLLTAWSVSIVPFWILVRPGNFIHDYYVLPFIIPFAVFGAAFISTLRYRFVYPLAILTLALGLAGLGEMKLFAATDPGVGRPNFCGMELRLIESSAHGDAVFFSSQDSTRAAH